LALATAASQVPAAIGQAVAVRVDVRDDLRRGVGQGLPAGVDGGEEVEVVAGVDRFAGPWPVVVGGDDVVAGVAHRGEQRRGARRHLGVRDDGAAKDEASGVVLGVVGREDDLHRES
jgi:hypothetical protein